MKYKMRSSSVLLAVIIVSRIMQHKNLFILALFGFISLASCTEVETCPGLPSPIFVDIAGCTGDPCILYNGGYADMNITFEGLTNTYTLVPRVRATLGITITYPLAPELQNACNWLLNGYCPIEKGEVLVYKLKMPMNFPTVTVLLEFSLIGDNNVIFQCFRIRATVRNPETELIE